MKNTIQFSISKGKKFYYATAIDFPIWTQAKDLNKLIKNIKEATKLYFKDEDFSKIGLNDKPSLFMNFELPQYA